MNIKVTVNNSFLHGIVETFICPNVDIVDLEEVDYCVEECCGQFLDMHGDAIRGLCPDIDWEVLAEACYYMVEEVNE